MFQKVAYLLLTLCIASSISTRISLEGDDWTITNNINHTAQGHVPGTIHTILFAAKQIPDPYVGFNDADLRYLIYQNWTFTKSFNLSSDFLAFNQFTLHFEQIDTVANITLNGCPIGQTNSMFIPYRFNVSSTCLKQNNQIEIDFESPVLYALRQSVAYNDTVPPDCTPEEQHGECHVQFIRKEPCSFSWDWGPAFGPIGIPRDISLDGVNTTDIMIRLESVNLASFDGTQKLWQVDVMLSSNNDPFSSNLKFELQNTTWSYQTALPFNHNLSVSVTIPDSKVLRWWPNGHGDQNLYTLVVSNDGKLIGSRTLGFRTIELIQHEYGSNITGLSFYFAINGQPIYVKGSNWIPPDSFQERVTDERLERLLRSAQLANMNMLRIWGGGIYERDSFYDLADQLGIMLWHDFMFACSLYPVDAPFLSNVYTEVIHQVKRLQSHASIVLWSGNNENEAAVAQNWYGVPDAKMNKTKDEYRKLYVDTVMTAVKQIDKGNNRPFVTSSPSNGLETITENYIAKDPQDPHYGDVHFYGYQDDSWNPTTYPITRFLSETGIQALPSLDTWYQTTSNASDLVFNSSLLIHREHSDHQLNAMLVHVQSNLPLPVTNDSLKYFTQMIYLSQINQAMTLKSISDVCRAHSSVDTIDPKTSLGHTMGLMYWQINDIWQAPTWATMEYGLKWKMGHNYVRHMYEPIYPIAMLTPYLANVTDENAQLSFYVANDLVDGARGDLICRIHSFDSFSPRISFGDDFTFDSAGLQNVMTYSYALLMKRVGCTDSSQCIIRCSLMYNKSEVHQTLFLTRPKNHQLSNPNIQIQTVKQISPNDFDIVLTAEKPALFVWLDVAANVTGYFLYNGFQMFEPTMTVRFHSWDPVKDFDKTNFDVRHMSLFDVTLP